MKRGWRIAALTDGIVLILSFGCMAWLNHRPGSGLAALSDVGWFALWYVVFQAALVAALLLTVCALIAYMRNRRK